MTKTALFVDLPNFYSNLLRSGIEEPRFLRDYFLYWLDFDLLAEALTKTNSFLGIWVFYSGERIGPSNERIEDKYLQKYIDRINSLRGVTAYNVNIPGDQREPVLLRCENCGKEQTGEQKSEKGIDASLTVHLFDTMDSWDVAFLLSGDADFVPAIASLRRRGKIVMGAGFSATASSALVRECYDYIDLCDAFLKEDVAAYTIFRESDGIVPRWLTDELHPNPDYHPSESLKLNFEYCWGGIHDDYYHVVLGVQRGLVDLSSLHRRIEEFQIRFPNQVEVIDLEKAYYEFRIGPLVSTGVERRFQRIVSSIEGLQLCRQGSYSMEYRYNRDKKTYELIKSS